MPSDEGRGVVDARDVDGRAMEPGAFHHLSQSLPQRDRWDGCQHVYVSMLRERCEDLELEPGQTRHTSENQSLRDRPHRAVMTKSSEPVERDGCRTGCTEVFDESAPEQWLPPLSVGQRPAERVDVVASFPGGDHAWSTQPVAVEQVGDGPGTTKVVRIGTHSGNRVATQDRVNCPGERVDTPRIVTVDQAKGPSPDGGREDPLDIGHDSVGATQALGELPGEPRFHAFPRNRHHLRGEYIGWWTRQDLGQWVDECLESLSCREV